MSDKPPSPFNKPTPTSPKPPTPTTSPSEKAEKPPTDHNLQLTDDIYITSNSLEDDRWKITMGFVTARPHEYLIHTRGGKILRKSTGQGNRCLKLPGDTVILVPTSLKQLIFEAGQLTLDNIHIRIRGYAIYRISQPEKAYERISFYNRTEGERKLALMIGEPCRSHAKWLVSNMTLEDCMRKRKEAIADILLAELRTVINEENSGVLIETIDIQDVRFGDNVLFKAYQAATRQNILKNEQLAELARQRDVETAKLQQELDLSARRKESKLAQLAHEAEIYRAEQEAQVLKDQDKRLADKEKTEHDLALLDTKEEHIRLRQQKDAETKQQIELQELDLVARKTEIDNTLSDSALQRIFYEETLPPIAGAIIDSMSAAKFTVYQTTDGAGISPLSMVLSEIMNIAQSKFSQEAKPKNADNL